MKRVTQVGVVLVLLVPAYQVYGRIRLNMSGAPRAALEQVAA